MAEKSELRMQKRLICEKCVRKPEENEKRD